MTAAADHGADPTPAHICRVRGQIGDAAASTSDLLDRPAYRLFAPIARGTAAAAVQTCLG